MLDGRPALRRGGGWADRDAADKHAPSPRVDVSDVAERDADRAPREKADVDPNPIGAGCEIAGDKCAEGPDAPLGPVHPVPAGASNPFPHDHRGIDHVGGTARLRGLAQRATPGISRLTHDCCRRRRSRLFATPPSGRSARHRLIILCASWIVRPLEPRLGGCAYKGLADEAIRMRIRAATSGATCPASRSTKSASWRRSSSTARTVERSSRQSIGTPRVCERAQVCRNARARAC